MGFICRNDRTATVLWPVPSRCHHLSLALQKTRLATALYAVEVATNSRFPGRQKSVLPLFNFSGRYDSHHGYQAYVQLSPTSGATADEFTELYHVIADEAPDAVKNGEIKNHFGRKVAIVCRQPSNFDAS